MRRRFFLERFSDDGSSASLRGEAAEHLGRVLRAQSGQLYELSDGNRVFLARVERVQIPKRGEASIDFTLLEAVESPESRLSLQLLLSVVKFDRFEWALEKATELGVTEIVPLAAARSGDPLLVAAARRRERWRKILVESAQQSRRLRAPELGELVRPEAAFASSRANLKIILSERGDAPALRAALPAASGEAPLSAALAIGPEGGWTDGEFSAARATSFAEASLGENILRTETAVIASLAVLRFALGG
ncbi:MAG: RsmE family RNA methyltransferase [Candidatus Acidiferrales bacterium]